jgi:sulfur-oxidizing protein SoxA
MKRILFLLAVALVLPAGVQASPAEDLKIYKKFFAERFPNVPDQELANGVYALDENLRANWEAIEEFPPYEDAIANGEKMFYTPFANGKTYKDCFPDAEQGIVQNYPYWDKEKGRVQTLAVAINECRTKNGEKPLKYAKKPIAELLAWFAYKSRGKVINVKIPEDDPRALAAYEAGKQFYFARRGQLNFSCAHCHFQISGQKLRSNVLSTGRGQVTHFPVYRSKWGAIGTLHRRFKGCNKQVRAKPFKPQGEEYRNLEYFLTHMSNGLKLNGPGARQ